MKVPEELHNETYMRLYEPMNEKTLTSVADEKKIVDKSPFSVRSRLLDREFSQRPWALRGQFTHCGGSPTDILQKESQPSSPSSHYSICSIRSQGR